MFTLVSIVNPFWEFKQLLKYSLAAYVDSAFELAERSPRLVEHIAVSSSETYRFSDLSISYLSRL